MTTCRKDISIPNQELDKLFCSWEWVETNAYGSFGPIANPASEGYSRTIEFDRNGIYRSYKDGKKDEKYKFTISEGTSNYIIGTAYIINYKRTGIVFNNDSPISSQAIQFKGSDTLILHILDYDGYYRIYKRQK
jgi:hypothetical protein